MSEFLGRLKAQGNARTIGGADASTEEEQDDPTPSAALQKVLFPWYDAFACEHPVDVANTVSEFITSKGRAPTPGEIRWSEVASRWVGEVRD